MDQPRKLTLIQELQPRPEQAPEGWEVWNAPRPMMGTVHFTGEFFHGIWYGAIDPADSVGDRFRKANHRDDGWILEWISLGQATAQIRAIYAVRYPGMNLLDQIETQIRRSTPEQIGRTFWDLVNREEGQ